MEYGIICLLPPIIAIVLALKTKQTLPSLFIAVMAWCDNYQRMESDCRIHRYYQRIYDSIYCKRNTTPDFWFWLPWLVDLLTC